MKQPGKLTTIFDAIVNVLAIAGALIIFFMMMSVSIGVIMRYFFNRSPDWLIEVSGYGLVFLTFLIAAWVLKEEGHVVIDMVLNHLSRKAQSLTNFATSVLATVVCFVITWYGVVVTLDHLERGALTPTELEFPVAFLVVVIPIGTLVLSIQFIRRSYGFWKKWRTLSTQQQEAS